MTATDCSSSAIKLKAFGRTIIYLLISGLAIGIQAAGALDAVSIGRIANQISVRIEGATEGSGVLVKREGSSYTVLTAYHVIKGNRPSEELYILTTDGKRHLSNINTIRRIGDVDLAVLSFETKNSYQVASIGSATSISSGDEVFVTGYPLPTTSVPVSIWRFLKGYVIANASVEIPGGYQLLYSNPTLPGMSGGSVLDNEGKLVGIHGRSEKDVSVSMATGKAVSTGTNQAIPITYYKRFSGDINELKPTTNIVATSDDYLAKADSLFWKIRLKQSESLSSTLADFTPEYQQVIRLITRSLSIKKSAGAYAMRAAAYLNSGKALEATNDYKSALVLEPNNIRVWVSLGSAYTWSGAYDLGEAKRAWKAAIAINPRDPENAQSYASLGYYSNFGRSPDQAIYYFNRSIELDPDNVNTLLMRAQAYSDKGFSDSSYYSHALADYSTAIDLESSNLEAITGRAELYNKIGEYMSAVKDYSTAISICESAKRSSKRDCDTGELRKKREAAYKAAL